MSTNIKSFLHTQGLPWVAKNSEDPSVFPEDSLKQLWIVPVDKSDPNYEDILNHLVKEFSNTKHIFTKKISGIIAHLYSSPSAEKFVFVFHERTAQAFTPKLFTEIETHNPTFLQKLLFVSSENIESETKIPNRLLTGSISKKEALFERDLEKHMPNIQCLNLKSYAGDDPNTSITRSLIYLESTRGIISEYGEKLLEIQLLIPKEDHDWLHDQLIQTIMCDTPDQMFLSIYRILEFFFPIKNISDLKERIGYQGTVLELREFCDKSLNWNLNHQYGSRQSIEYCSHRFAEIFLGESISAQSEPQEIRRLKERAIEKISKLRHALTHQTFGIGTTTSEDINRAIQALLTLLQESFSHYSGQIDI